MKWDDKPYYSLSYYLKKTYGEKIYKIALDGGFTCPNRDGTIDTRGCIFCSQGGSGEFAIKHTEDSIDAMILEGISKFKGKKIGDKYIAYFQAYTNTYAPIDKLWKLYSTALSSSKVIGISIATRPDCIDNSVLELLCKLKETYKNKSIWIELGLQTIHEKSISYIRRGYTNEVFKQCAISLHKENIPFIVHTILGLPFETKADVLETINYVNSFHPFGIKLQLLHVLKGTDLLTDYQNGVFETLSKESYLDLLADCIAHLDPNIVIHRITGDGPRSLLVSPMYSLNKKDMLNSFHRLCKEKGVYQGKLYS